MTENSLAQLTSPSQPQLDLSLWHPDVRAVIRESELLPALSDFTWQLEHKGVKDYREEQWSGFIGRAWNAFVSSLPRMLLMGGQPTQARRKPVP